MSRAQFVEVMMRLPPKLYKDLKTKGYLEIVTRDLKQRYEPFIRLAMSKAAPNKEVANQLLQITEKLCSIDTGLGHIAAGVAQNSAIGLANAGLTAANIAITKQGFAKVTKQLTKIASIGYLNSALSSANLVVSAAGFVIINQKINSLSRTMDGIAATLERIEAKLDNEIIQEYQEIALQFSNLTTLVEGYGAVESQELLKWLSRAQPFMNKIINNMASNAMSKDIALEMLFTLVPAYTSVVILAMREYRFSTGKNFGSINNYLALYNQLMDEKFIDEVSNYLFIEKNTQIRETLEAAIGHMLLVGENLTQVQDEMKILEVVSTREDYKAYTNAMYDTMKLSMEENVSEIAKKTGMSEQECEQIVEQAFAVA